MLQKRLLHKTPSKFSQFPVYPRLWGRKTLELNKGAVKVNCFFSCNQCSSFRFEINSHLSIHFPGKEISEWFEWKVFIMPMNCDFMYEVSIIATRKANSKYNLEKIGDMLWLSLSYIKICYVILFHVFFTHWPETRRRQWGPNVETWLLIWYPWDTWQIVLTPLLRTKKIQKEDTEQICEALG